MAFAPVDAPTDLGRAKFPAVDAWLKNHVSWWMAVLVGIGFLLRMRVAVNTYLSPDDALHFLVANADWGEVWTRWRWVHHPPLLIFIERLTIPWSISEPALRLIPVLTGTLYPLAAFLWVRKVIGFAGALAAFLFLMFTPHQVTLSAQVRGYPMAFLFMALSLWMFEEALERNSARWMAGFTLCLYGAIVSEYSICWYVAAMGVYALIRLPGKQIGNAVRAVWLAGQAGALGLYGYFWAVHLSTFPNSGSAGNALGRWLHDSYLQPGQSIAFFVAHRTLSLLSYAFGSQLEGAIGGCLLIAGLWAAWKRNLGAIWVILAVPFLLSAAGAILHLLPYGGSRHSGFLLLFLAVLVAAAVQRWWKFRPAVTALCLVLLYPLWMAGSRDEELDIEHARNQKVLMLDGLQYLRTNIPPDAAVITDVDGFLQLGYYFGLRLNSPSDHFIPQVHDLEGRKLVPIPAFHRGGTLETRLARLAEVKKKFGLNESQPVWMVEAGWEVRFRPPRMRPYPFSRVISISTESDLREAVAASRQSNSSAPAQPEKPK